MVDGRIVSDVMLRDAVAICEFLKAVDVLRDLTPADLTQVAERMTKRRYATGEIIIRQGEIGEEFFLIVAGSVAVTRSQPGGSGRETELATLRRGDFFGEHALITGEPRNATVRAAEDLEIYVLDKENFRIAIERSTSFKDQLARAYFQRQ
jgi:putative ABC transport system ATP-binding protein